LFYFSSPHLHLVRAALYTECLSFAQRRVELFFLSSLPRAPYTDFCLARTFSCTLGLTLFVANFVGAGLLDAH